MIKLLYSNNILRMDKVYTTTLLHLKAGDKIRCADGGEATILSVNTSEVSSSVFKKVGQNVVVA